MGKHVLLVDDEVVICEALATFLADHGHRVSYATTGEDALAQALHADLAICDRHLGSENGLEVIERLKRVRPELKVLILTAYPTIEALQLARDLGIVGFLTKPLGLPELLTSVDRAFGSELGAVFLFPSTLKDKLADIVPYLGEVTAGDPPNWLRVRTQLRTVAPACVLVDASAPEVLDFLDACRRELEGRAVFVLCRDDDFNVARQLVGRLPAAKCLTYGTSSTQLPRNIREHVMNRREESERVRMTLAQQIGRCDYAASLHIGYFCTISGRCPYGEVKDAVVTVKGKDHHRCPRRPFSIPRADKVGLLTWDGVPDEAAVIGYRALAMDAVHRGKTHIVVNAQALESPHFNLVEILADVEAGLADKPDARVDVINLSPRLLAAMRKAGSFLVAVQFHGRVLLELETPR